MRLRIDFDIQQDWLIDFAAYTIALAEKPLPVTKTLFLKAVRAELHENGIELARNWRDYVWCPEQNTIRHAATLHVAKLFKSSGI